MILRYTMAWIPMVFMAIANGALRQLGYGPYMSKLAAHQISCFTAVAIFFIYTYLLSGRWPFETSRQARSAGAIWVVLTVALVMG